MGILYGAGLNLTSLLPPIFILVIDIIDINLPGTYGKLQCKREPYQYSGWGDSLVQTDRDSVTFIQGYINFKFFYF